jgi:putative hydrolase of the HAD superfamily
VKAMEGAGLVVEDFEEEVARLEAINNKARNTPEALITYITEKEEDVDKYMEIGKRAVYDYDFSGLIRPMRGAISAIEELSKLGTDMAIVTKGNEERQLKKIDLAGIDKELFKEIRAVKDYDKTQPYKEIMQNLNYLPNETLVVGDRYKTDLLPGKNLGTKTAWILHGRGRINPPREKEVDYTVSDLMQIVNIVKNS